MKERPRAAHAAHTLARLVAVCSAVCLMAGLLAVGCADPAPDDAPGTGGVGGGPVAGTGGRGPDGNGVDAGADPGGGHADAGVDTIPRPPGAGGTGGTGRPDAGSDGGGVTTGVGGRFGDGGVTVAGAGGRLGTGGATGTLPPVTVYIAGDSTVSDYPPTAANMQAGWGQLLPERYTAQVTVSNQAIGGRTSRRFIEEGRLTTILNTIRPGDYLMVQFGTNDGNTTAVYPDGEPYLVSTADFQGFMMQYISGARAHQAIPILVTPPPRRSCTGDSHTFGNGLAGYAAAMKTVAAATGAALVDLNASTLAYLDMIGCVASGNFFLLGDGTHFQLNGARIMAGFVADGVRGAALPLAAYAKP